MSEFLSGYNPEENLSPQEEHPSSEGNLSFPETSISDSQTPDSSTPDSLTPETQSSITLEQVVELVDQSPEIKEFILSKKWNPEELADLYHVLQEMIKDNPDNLTTTNLIKKLTAQLLDTAYPQTAKTEEESQERSNKLKRLLQKIAAATTAALLAFLGPIAFKNRSASAAENNDSAKSKAPTGTEEQAPETATATNENIAALVDQDLTETTNALEQETPPEEETVEVRTVDEWTFDYEKDVDSLLRDAWSEADFNKLVADIKSTDYYERQIALIEQYSRLGEPVSTAAVGTAWTIAFKSAETQRFKDMLTVPSVKEVDGDTAYQTLLYLYNLYQEEVVDTADVTSTFNSIFNESTDERWVAYEDLDALEENKATVVAFAKRKFEVDGKAISLKDLNKKIDVLIKQAKKLSSNKKNVAKIWAIGEEMISLMEIRRQAFIEVFLQLKNKFGENFTIPEIKLSDYPIPNTSDVTTALGISPK